MFKFTAIVLFVSLALASAAQVAQINLYRGDCSDASELAEYQVYDQCSKSSQSGDYEKATCSESGVTIFNCEDSGCNSCTSVTFRADQCIPNSNSGYSFQYSCVESAGSEPAPSSSAFAVAPVVALVASVVAVALF
eukprot:TRINITY_DN32711_c0_g1_i1.p1 TRINITY_DN32711_c0_g1~~TRINITY_DN32711_c0_g1_i1.p1  ORF type:complete len:136 (+),score=54.23 TRINITY_DN32711_c0_g1_i1:19-426(+)